MQELEIFKNEEFGEIRTLMIDGEPWFVGKDIADILEYRNGSRDINRHIDEEDRRKSMIFDGNQNKETIIINESGLYSLILSSKLPNAKKFKRWITTDILPTIRKTGGYVNNDEGVPCFRRVLVIWSRETRHPLRVGNFRYLTYWKGVGILEIPLYVTVDFPPREDYSAQNCTVRMSVSVGLTVRFWTVKFTEISYIHRWINQHKNTIVKI